MAAGLPVVASAVGAAKEILVDGETGILASSEEEWLQGIVRLVQDAALRKSFGLAGRKRVERFFSLQATAQRLESILGWAAFPTRDKLELIPYYILKGSAARR